MPERSSGPIAAIVPRGTGHQFVLYGDACSGEPGAPHEITFARTNAAVARLEPAPEFVVFAGDEIAGLTTDEAELRKQWHHWLDVEMAWLDRTSIPLYNATSNHTTYDTMSERVFSEVLAHLPANGAPGQDRLSYYVRRGDLLLVFVHTSWSGLGGEGHVETDWLHATLTEQADARFKFVIGHHPVFPVNGFSGEQQRELNHEAGVELWALLIRHGVMAFLCSHILAFDVQVHDGVLQIVTAGAGTAHRMPEETEYLHFVQAAVDEAGLRYQVIDQTAIVREQLQWPLTLAPTDEWVPLPVANSLLPVSDDLIRAGEEVIAATTVSGLQFVGTAADGDDGTPQTLLATTPQGFALPALWIGLTGPSQRLTVTLAPTPGRSPHYWFGPDLQPGQPFELQLALHDGMGPGGLLHRPNEYTPWSSLRSSSAWGLERFDGTPGWRVGLTGAGPTGRSGNYTVGHIGQASKNQPFRGSGLKVSHSPLWGPSGREPSV